MKYFILFLSCLFLMISCSMEPSEDEQPKNRKLRNKGEHKRNDRRSNKFDPEIKSSVHVENKDEPLDASSPQPLSNTENVAPDVPPVMPNELQHVPPDILEQMILFSSSDNTQIVVEESQPVEQIEPPLENEQLEKQLEPDVNSEPTPQPELSSEENKQTTEIPKSESIEEDPESTTEPQDEPPPEDEENPQSPIESDEPTAS